MLPACLYCCSYSSFHLSPLFLPYIFPHYFVLSSIKNFRHPCILGLVGFHASLEIEIYTLPLFQVVNCAILPFPYKFSPLHNGSTMYTCTHAYTHYTDELLNLRNSQKQTLIQGLLPKSYSYRMVEPCLKIQVFLFKFKMLSAVTQSIISHFYVFLYHNLISW